MVGWVEIYVEFLSSFEYIIKNMFRKLGKDIIACVGRCCNGFEELKEMNVIIPEIHEKMWEEVC
jgi:hypothetical protein